MSVTFLPDKTVNFGLCSSCQMLHNVMSPCLTKTQRLEALSFPVYRANSAYYFIPEYAQRLGLRPDGRTFKLNQLRKLHE